MKSLKILIVLVHSSKNIGDRAILESTIQRLNSVFTDPQITILSNYPDEPYFKTINYSVESSPWVIVGNTERRSIIRQIIGFLSGIGWALLTYINKVIFNKMPSFIPKNWCNLFQVYGDSDIVIGSGGNQFYSSGKYGWPFPLNALSVWLAHLFKKPFYAMPQSIGPLKRRWEQKLIFFLYKKNRFTYLRDRRSIQLAHEIGLTPVQYAPDLAFRVVDGEVERALKILRKYKFDKNKNNIGMTIIAPMGLALNQQHVNIYYEQLALLIERLIICYDCDVFIFRQVSGPSGLEDDGLANIYVSKMLKTSLSNRLHLINEEFSPIMLMSLYQQMDLFIASRLHSGIFSLCSKVPTVFIGYLSKTLGVLESLGLEAWGVELSEIDSEKLWHVISRAWEQKEDLRLLIGHMLPKVVIQTNHVIENVFNDYKDLSAKINGNY